MREDFTLLGLGTGFWDTFLGSRWRWEADVIALLGKGNWRDFEDLLLDLRLLLTAY